MHSSLNMNGFIVIVTLLIAAGVVSGCERVEVKRGETKVVAENKSGSDVRRLTLHEATDCIIPKQEIVCCRYCSPGEKKSGCTNKNCSTFVIDTKDSVSFNITPLNASDGCYIAQVIFNNSNEETVLIVVNGKLPRTVIPDPPPQENPEANSTKDTEIPGTDDLSTLGFTGAVAVAIAVAVAVAIAVAIAVGFLVWCCLKKKKNNESKPNNCKKDPKDNSLIESNIKAGEQGDSFKMGDRIPRSEDHSLNAVLIHNPSVGQENERPGQHVQHNNSDDYDDNSKHNNSNNDIVIFGVIMRMMMRMMRKVVLTGFIQVPEILKSD